MAEALTPPKSYLSPADRARIKSELDEIRARRRATDQLGDGAGQFYRPPEVSIDDASLRAKEERLQRVLERESAPQLSPTQRNAAYKEFTGLVREFEENALTKQEQGYGYPEIMKKREGAEHDFERAKTKIMAWEMGARGQHVTQRLKQLAGIIDPENPDLRNLENYRRRK